jgi:hypothetical protein
MLMMMMMMIYIYIYIKEENESMEEFLKGMTKTLTQLEGVNFSILGELVILLILHSLPN